MWITRAMTMTDQSVDARSSTPDRWPDWVPESALTYITHTERGLSIRALARRKGCHPSTVLRQIRRIEARRDDPLVDEALHMLGEARRPANDSGGDIKYPRQDAVIDGKIIQSLRALSTPGTILAIADRLERAVILDTSRAGGETRLVVPREVALLLALRGWISCQVQGRVSQYGISPAGRVALGQMTALRGTAERTFGGFADAQSSFFHDDGDGVDLPDMRYATSENPVVMLARRRDGTGAPFLTQDLVDAAERLRQDYVLSEMRAGGRASDRIAAVMDELGPGLADVALRCCCKLEGLESAEREMGWSARSGKIVLRIALQRLRRHYDMAGDEAGMIG